MLHQLVLTPSRASSFFFTAGPKTYSPIASSAATTRWQGTRSGTGLFARVVRTASAARGRFTSAASHAYVRTWPRAISHVFSRTRRWNSVSAPKSSATRALRSPASPRFNLSTTSAGGFGSRIGIVLNRFSCHVTNAASLSTNRTASTPSRPYATNASPIFVGTLTYAIAMPRLASTSGRADFDTLAARDSRTAVARSIGPLLFAGFGFAGAGFERLAFATHRHHAKSAIADQPSSPVPRQSKNVWPIAPAPFAAARHHPISSGDGLPVVPRSSLWPATLIGMSRPACCCVSDTESAH